jgi:hypothetical protein
LDCCCIDKEGSGGWLLALLPPRRGFDSLTAGFAVAAKGCLNTDLFSSYFVYRSRGSGIFGKDIGAKVGKVDANFDPGSVFGDIKVLLMPALLIHLSKMSLLS